MRLYGREEITTEAEEITSENVVMELYKALETHRYNARQIDYLYNYYKGKHPNILARQKLYNEKVNHKITVNRAAEIVDFKTGFLLSQPVQIIGRDKGASVDEVSKLNDYFHECGKQQQDMELLDWLHICGVGYRIVLPQINIAKESPFRTYVLDPRSTFVVYRSDLEHKRMFAVKYVYKDYQKGKEPLYSVWTDTHYYEIFKGMIITEEERYYGAVPIVEYTANLTRQGCFESVLDLLDAIDEVESDRADSIENFVQALLLFKNCDIEDESFQRLKELGGLKVPEGGDVSYLVQELNQTQTQELVDDMYDAVLTICGIPGRSGQKTASTSDTGSGVMLRNGWQSATTYAAKTVSFFTRAEKETLALALTFATDLGLVISSLDIKFPYKNYQNSLEQAQILQMMLQETGMVVHPQLAFAYCGAFPDATQAYEMSKAYTEEIEKKKAEETENNAENNLNGDRDPEQNNTGDTGEGQHSGDTEEEE